MKNYLIMTDSGCDVDSTVLKQWDIECIPLYFRKNDSEENLSIDMIGYEQFYESMKQGDQYKTSAINPETFEEIFEPRLKEGKDILFIGISSHLSGTVSFAAMAARNLKDRYPDKRIEAVDSCSATNGISLILQLAFEYRKEGKDITEAAVLLREAAENLKNWVSVDTLQYFVNSGKIEGSKALIASILNLKPVMDFEKAGSIVQTYKCRGRIKALYEMAMKYCENDRLIDNGRYCIANADCHEDALRLQEIIFEKTGRKAELISQIGPVIGAHCGPGTIALFFIEDKNRN